MQQITSILTRFILLFSISSNLSAQVRLSYVSIDEELATVKNFGSDEVDLSEYRIVDGGSGSFQICSSFEINEGNIIVSGGGSTTFKLFTMESQSFLAFYAPISDAEDIMLDFVQWGGCCFSEHETIAGGAGIWEEGSYIDFEAPYYYIGNGNENGVGFWGDAPSSDPSGDINVRFIYIDPDQSRMGLKNYGQNIDIKSFRLLILGIQLGQLSDYSIIKGALDMATGDTVIIEGVNMEEKAYAALYLPDSGNGTDEFIIPLFMQDFVQWGESFSDEYEFTAEDAGIWTVGEYITEVQPYYYTGNGVQNGASFWSGQTISIPGPNIRLVYVNPMNNEIGIKNYGLGAENISNYILSSELNATNNLTSQTLIKGTFNLLSGDTTVIMLSGTGGNLSSLDTITGDLALYKNNYFTDTSALIDFVQWGSGGNGREAVAASKGIWSIGEFVLGKYPYIYLGNGALNGAAYWLGDTTQTNDTTGGGDTNTSITFVNDHISINIYPNPVTNDFFTIENSQHNYSDQLVLQIFNMLGEEINTIQLQTNKKTIYIDNGTIPKGNYVIKVTNSTIKMDKILLIK